MGAEQSRVIREALLFFFTVINKTLKQLLLSFSWNILPNMFFLQIFVLPLSLYSNFPFSIRPSLTIRENSHPSSLYYQFPFIYSIFIFIALIIVCTFYHAMYYFVYSLLCITWPIRDKLPQGQNSRIFFFLIRSKYLELCPVPEEIWRNHHITVKITVA